MFSIGGALSALPYVAAVAAALLLYDRFIDDPAVRLDARRGYVAEAERAALQAELGEARRQRDAAEKAAKAWLEQLQRYQAEEDVREKLDDALIAEYEGKLSDAKRACRRLDADDLRLLGR